MPKLDYITVKGFKSISAIEKFELGPITVLIGANGSGKSNLVGIFTLLNALREGRLREYVIRTGGANRILHFGSRTTDRMVVEFSQDDGERLYRIELIPTGADELVPLAEYVCVNGQESGHIQPSGSESAIRREVQWRSGMLPHLSQLFDGLRVYHFHDTGSSSPLKRTCDVHDNRFLRSDGSNLAAFLHLLGHRHNDAYRAIVQAVRQVAPFFVDFDLQPSELDPNKIRLEWVHEGTAAYFDGSSLSDGTLRFIALATLFLQPQEYMSSVIIVDEPELGLHPSAISLLASMIQYAATETQVIVSTQSSHLVDHFDPEDVVVAERVNGSTNLTRLESSRLERWLDDYSLGELWEKNEFGGKPKPE